jgi:hypothetical protein
VRRTPTPSQRSFEQIDHRRLTVLRRVLAWCSLTTDKHNITRLTSAHNESQTLFIMTLRISYSAHFDSSQATVRQAFQVPVNSVRIAVPALSLNVRRQWLYEDGSKYHNTVGERQSAQLFFPRAHEDSSPNLASPPC